MYKFNVIKLNTPINVYRCSFINRLKAIKYIKEIHLLFTELELKALRPSLLPSFFSFISLL